MKFSPPILFLLSVAGAVTCLFAAVACETTRTGGLTSHLGPLLELSSGEPVEIKATKFQFGKALQKYAVDYNAQYCEKSDGNIVCDKFTPKTIGDILTQMKTKGVTKSARAETGQGDEMKTEAVNVSQRARFNSPEKLEDFLNALDGK